jgi:hypothetical protein
LLALKVLAEQALTKSTRKTYGAEMDSTLILARLVETLFILGHMLLVVVVATEIMAMPAQRAREM